MKLSHLGAVTAVALSLAACSSSSGSAAIQALSPELRAGATVTQVRLRNVPTRNVSENFSQTFETQVGEALNRCADGQQPLTLEVSISGYYAPNPVMAALAPMKSEISGTARLRDASGTVVGEYRIQRSLMVGGYAGAVIHAFAERNMASAFGEELCNQAFAPERPARRR